MAREKIIRQNLRASGWQAECRQINSDKAKRRRRDSWRRRCYWVGGVMMVAYLALTVGWLWHSGMAARLSDQADQWARAQLAKTGFVVSHLTIGGLEQLDAQAVIGAAEISQGAPILLLSLSEMKTKLEDHPQILSASVERELPNRLRITIEERRPVAVWQHQGAQHWLDVEGKLLADSRGEDVPLPEHVLVLTGDDAPRHMPDLQALLNAAPDMREQVKAAQWVGRRRWNVWLANQVNVMLPAEGAVDRWHQLAALNRQHNILDRQVDSIDLRLAGKAFVRYKESVNPQTPFDAQRLTTALLQEAAQ